MKKLVFHSVLKLFFSLTFSKESSVTALFILSNTFRAVEDREKFQQRQPVYCNISRLLYNIFEKYQTLTV